MVLNTEFGDDDNKHIIAVNDYDSAFFGKLSAEDQALVTEDDRKKRQEIGTKFADDYYDLLTDTIMDGWGEGFHYCRIVPGEPIWQARARHEHYLAHMIGITRGANVLECGSGLGGPAREMARFVECNVTGISINKYQIGYSRKLTKEVGLSDKVKFVQGDFMKLPFADNTFDYVYSIEATAHAPDLNKCYKEIFRVLKPGGRFGTYEWCMTDAFDAQNAAHCAIRSRIERGNG
ncbi:Delta(24)-sterol C-methyltransferase, partial [Elasticomyces elasticus]